MEDARLRLETAARHYRSWSGNRKERSHAYAQLAGGLTAVLDGQVRELAMRFVDDPAREEWDEVCTVFLDQVRNALSKIPF